MDIGKDKASNKPELCIENEQKVKEGENFSYMTVTNGNMFDSYYVNNESNTTYLIHYSIEYDKDNKCKSEYTNFISSLSIKE